MNALVAGNGSYIVRPCGHDLHGPTVPINVENKKMILFSIHLQLLLQEQMLMLITKKLMNTKQLSMLGISRLL